MTLLTAMTDMAENFVLILLLCLFALVIVRLMGSRTVGQLSPFDFIIMVGVGDLIVTTALDRNQRLLSGLGGLLALLLLQRLLSYLSLKSTTLRRLFEGVPVVLIRNGKIIEDNFRKTRFNFDDLRQEMHKLGMDMTEIKDIQIARLESCGMVTIIKSRDLEPLSKRELDNYFTQMRTNPLSPIGLEWQRIESMMDDVQKIARDVEELKNKFNK